MIIRNKVCVVLVLFCSVLFLGCNGEVSVVNENQLSPDFDSLHSELKNHMSKADSVLYSPAFTFSSERSDSMKKRIDELDSIDIHGPDRTPEENINLQNEVFSDSFLMKLDSVAKKKK